MSAPALWSISSSCYPPRARGTRRDPRAVAAHPPGGAPASRGRIGEEIRALRESSFGSDAAARLEQLDRARVAWQERLNDYRDARAAIEHEAGLSADERAARARRLLAETFTPASSAASRALDRIAHEPADEPRDESPRRLTQLEDGA